MPWKTLIKTELACPSYKRGKLIILLTCCFGPLQVSVMQIPFPCVCLCKQHTPTHQHQLVWTEGQPQHCWQMPAWTTITRLPRLQGHTHFNPLSQGETTTFNQLPCRSAAICLCHIRHEKTPKALLCWWLHSTGFSEHVCADCTVYTYRSQQSWNPSSMSFLHCRFWPSSVLLLPQILFRTGTPMSFILSDSDYFWKFDHYVSCLLISEKSLTMIQVEHEW